MVDTYLLPDSILYFWDAECLMFAERCREAAITQGKSRQKFLRFIRRCYSVDGLKGIRALGKELFGVSAEGRV
jgi:hypothetical protein